MARLQHEVSHGFPVCPLEGDIDVVVTGMFRNPNSLIFRERLCGVHASDTIVDLHLCKRKQESVPLEKVARFAESSAVLDDDEKSE